MNENYFSKKLNRALDGKQIVLEEHGGRVFKIDAGHTVYLREVIAGPSRPEWEIAATPGFMGFSPMPKSYDPANRDFMKSPKKTDVLYWEIHKRGENRIPVLGNYGADWSGNLKNDVEIYMTWAKNRLNHCFGDLGQKLISHHGDEHPRYSKRI